MSQDEFKRVINILEDAILATDLAVYFRRRRETFDLVESNAVNFGSDQHRCVWSTEAARLLLLKFMDDFLLASSDHFFVGC